MQCRLTCNLDNSTVSILAHPPVSERLSRSHTLAKLVATHPPPPTMHNMTSPRIVIAIPACCACLLPCSAVCLLCVMGSNTWPDGLTHWWWVEQCPCGGCSDKSWKNSRIWSDISQDRTWLAGTAAAASRWHSRSRISLAQPR